MKTIMTFVGFVLLVPLTGRAQPKIDVSNHAITCATMYGTASSSPPLVVGGTATSRTMTVRGSVAGCRVTGPGGVIILSGRMSGRVTAGSNECVVLHEPLAGTLTIAWKADPSTPILQRSSTLEITDVTFDGFGAPWGGPAYGRFSLGIGRVTGAFTGGDAGATSANVAVTSQDLIETLARCSSPDGLRKLNVGLGTITLR